MIKQNEYLKQELDGYKEEIKNKYVDFYIRDIGFLSTYEITLNSAMAQELEKDILAFKRIIYDVFNYNYVQ